MPLAKRPRPRSTARRRWCRTSGRLGYLPEETLEAYQLAIDQGADVIEFDLISTRMRVVRAARSRAPRSTSRHRPEFAVASA